MKRYLKPEVEIMIFSSQDVITLSGTNTQMTDWGDELNGEDYSFE